MNITRGDKVVCVDDSPSKCNCCAGMKCPLILNNVYVVSDSGLTSTGHAFIEVIGVKPEHHHKIFGFHAGRFRLLAEMKALNAQKIKPTKTNQCQT